MMLSDREWLRFFTFAMIVGGILGAVYVGALRVSGWPLMEALVAAIALVAVLALVLHAIVRTLLDGSGGEADSAPDEPAETQEDTA